MMKRNKLAAAGEDAPMSGEDRVPPQTPLQNRFRPSPGNLPIQQRRRMPHFPRGPMRRVITHLEDFQGMPSAHKHHNTRLLALLHNVISRWNPPPCQPVAELGTAVAFPYSQITKPDVVPCSSGALLGRGLISLDLDTSLAALTPFIAGNIFWESSRPDRMGISCRHPGARISLFHTIYSQPWVVS